ncbi:sugar O-acyltransferase (sialic acid O-acetyltransferase NeuD family) [Homoserinimonas aerilata]|uniref:Sugar O-acyltransferase (Sialic acid O-acetyltransferase NeuD family) n=1 Tax=Homoserinimonas aerilata TaxID=1162970 RepID=A0A542Y1P7_9MICO|nr:NeuD/PglB/VioB family sugar acetyltransferase [Homoserinimonas aerilata]TQL42006.1 sugar O-acyltransferase (sialic acid O-acetyltransferase NeuD family) [Homoserinimonas aerilata]
MSELLLLGASGLAREALAVLRKQGEHTVLGCLDDDPTTWDREYDRMLVFGGIEQVERFPGAKLLVCVGKGSHRATLSQRLIALGRDDHDYATVIDESVSIPAGCLVGAGSILLAGSVLTTNVTIGRHVVVMPHVTLTHDAFVESFATLCAGVTLGGNVLVGERSYLGMNSSVREGLRVGRDAVLGMGAVLLDELPPGQTWAGVPARQILRAAS